MSSVGNTLGGGVAGLLGSQNTASAQGQLGMAQLGQQQGDRAYLMPTQQEQDQLKQALDVNNQSISQSQKLLASTDPALIEAGTQALQLMQGKSAQALAPIQNQRAQQRQQLMQQLQSSLGPGAANSSAGIQALNNFDQQTSNMMAGAQQNTLNSFLGYASGARQMGQGQQQQGISNLQNITQEGQNMRLTAVRGASVNGGLSQMGNLANAQANQAGMGALIGAGSAAFGGGGVGSLGALFGSSGGGGQTAQQTTPAFNMANAGGSSSPYEKAAGWAHGGKVPGMAMFAGDHPGNDVVDAKLSPGEIVIPRSHSNDPKKAMAFLKTQFKKNKQVKGVSKMQGSYDQGTVNPLGATTLANPAFAVSPAWDPVSAAEERYNKLMGHMAPQPVKKSTYHDPQNDVIIDEDAPKPVKRSAEYEALHSYGPAPTVQATEPAGPEQGYYRGGKIVPHPDNPRRVLPKEKKNRMKHYA